MILNLLHALSLILGAYAINEGKSPIPKLSKVKFFQDMQKDKVSITVRGSSCRDISYNCRHYKSYCSSRKDVGSLCMDTCGLCFEKKAPKVEKDCRDSHPRCKLLSKRYCRGTFSQRSFMSSRCKKSCRVCTPPANTWPTSRNCGVAPLRKYRFRSLTADGKPSTLGSYPWQAAVTFKGKFHCGASLIDKQYLLSAAHCYSHLKSYQISEFRVILGEHNLEWREGSEKSFEVATIVVHKDHVGGIYNNNLALVKLSNPIEEYTSKIQPICLPSEDEKLAPGTTCQISGWGQGETYPDGQKSNRLQETPVKVVDSYRCARKTSQGGAVVTNNTLCARIDDSYKFQPTFYGNSGGPMQCGKDGTWTLYGVVSCGSPICKQTDTYVFTKMSGYRNWINRAYRVTQ